MTCQQLFFPKSLLKPAMYARNSNSATKTVWPALPPAGADRLLLIRRGHQDSAPVQSRASWIIDFSDPLER